jgi:tetratricopeptide (TPR) repeat protein
LGLFYSDNKQNNKALDSFLSCVPFITNPNTAITLYINIADENKFLGNKNEALKYYNLAYDISLKNKTYNNLEFLSRELAKIYEEKKEWNLFREMMNLHLVYNDSNLKVNAVQQIQRQQLEFDFERKRMTDSPASRRGFFYVGRQPFVPRRFRIFGRVAPEQFPTAPRAQGRIFYLLTKAFTASPALKHPGGASLSLVCELKCHPKRVTV